VVFEIEEGAGARPEAGGAGAWIRVIDVLKTEAGSSWRYLFEKERGGGSRGV
jgi:hypothetical protein